MSKLPKKYKHLEIESKWQDSWKEKDVYKWQNDLPKERNFVIDTPPPTVSGVLHMGHIFSYCQADFIARYKRMKGFDVFYPMGFDDNGLPTERLVEKTIKRKAVSMQKREFIFECKKIVADAEIEFEDLFSQIALSVDWNQKYQTISDKSQKLAQSSFIDLYNKKLVEKKFDPVFWDIADKTALAGADLIDKEFDSFANDIIFKINETDQDLIVMTTRPELLPACVAVMIHPEDEKYKNLHGKFAISPIFNVKIPIILDEDVKMDKGTGAVMCCTFGDEMDIKWWKKHDLDLRIILSENGKILPTEDISKINNDNFNHTQYQKIEGTSIKEARKIIIEILKEENLLIKSDPIKHSVKSQKGLEWQLKYWFKISGLLKSSIKSRN